jgi:enoyl-CoA hydratase/carnithine racemase
MSVFEKILSLPASRGGVEVEEIATGVAQIRLNRPERMNALGVETTNALLAIVQEVLAGDARVLVVRGTGKAFCAGADLKERKEMAEPARIAHNRAINAAVNALDAAPIPTIAALNGLALGGGCEMALGCDIRIAMAGVQIGLTEARIGAFPGAGGSQRLPRLVGVSRALEMILSGEPVTAERAAEIGLVNMVFPPETFDERLATFAGLLASRSPTASALAKKAIRQGMEKSLVEGLEIERQALMHVLGSADYAEGLAAFAEKRPPRFAPRNQKA